MFLLVLFVFFVFYVKSVNVGEGLFAFFNLNEDDGTTSEDSFMAKNTHLELLIASTGFHDSINDDRVVEINSGNPTPFSGNSYYNYDGDHCHRVILGDPNAGTENLDVHKGFNDMYSAHTISFWFKLDVTNIRHDIIYRKGESDYYMYVLQIAGSPFQVHYKMTKPGDTTNLWEFKTNLVGIVDAGKWYHFSQTFNYDSVNGNTEYNLYIDGVKRTTEFSTLSVGSGSGFTYSPNPSITLENQPILFGIPGTRGAKMNVALLYFWKRKLASSEVLELIATNKFNDQHADTRKPYRCLDADFDNVITIHGQNYHQCIECITNFYLLPDDIGGSDCLLGIDSSPCPPGYYHSIYSSSEPLKCVKCSEPDCEVCETSKTSTVKDVCTKCFNYMLLGSTCCQNANSYCATCNADRNGCATCTSSSNKVSGVCCSNTVNSNCDTCISDGSKCSDCSSTYHLQSDGTCKTGCNDAHCLTCPSSPDVCTKCETNYVVFKNGCCFDDVQKDLCKTCSSDGTYCWECISGYYMDPTSSSKVCKKCAVENCQTCTLPTTCDACTGELKFCNGKCNQCCSSQDCSALSGSSCTDNVCNCPKDKPKTCSSECSQCCSDADCGITETCDVGFGSCKCKACPSATGIWNKAKCPTISSPVVSSFVKAPPKESFHSPYYIFTFDFYGYENVDYMTINFLPPSSSSGSNLCKLPIRNSYYDPKGDEGSTKLQTSWDTDFTVNGECKTTFTVHVKIEDLKNTCGWTISSTSTTATFLGDVVIGVSGYDEYKILDGRRATVKNYFSTETKKQVAVTETKLISVSEFAVEIQLEDPSLQISSVVDSVTADYMLKKLNIKINLLYSKEQFENVVKFVSATSAASLVSLKSPSPNTLATTNIETSTHYIKQFVFEFDFGSCNGGAETISFTFSVFNPESGTNTDGIKVDPAKSLKMDLSLSIDNHCSTSSSSVQIKRCTTESDLVCSSTDKSIKMGEFSYFKVEFNDFKLLMKSVKIWDFMILCSGETPPTTLIEVFDDGKATVDGEDWGLTIHKNDFAKGYILFKFFLPFSDKSDFEGHTAHVTKFAMSIFVEYVTERRMDTMERVDFEFVLDLNEESKNSLLLSTVVLIVVVCVGVGILLALSVFGFIIAVKKKRMISIHKISKE